MPQRWTDTWVKALKHPASGSPEIVFHDPTLNKHPLVVNRTRKIFEAWVEQPLAFNGGHRKTFVEQVGDANDITVEAARERAAVILSRIRKCEDPRSRSAEREATVAGACEEFKKRDDTGPSTLDVYEQSYELVLKPGPRGWPVGRKGNARLEGTGGDALRSMRSRYAYFGWNQMTQGASGTH